VSALGVGMSVHHRRDRREQVMAWVRRQCEPFEVNELRSGLSITRANAHKILSNLVAEKKVVRVSFGLYRRIS